MLDIYFLNIFAYNTDEINNSQIIDLITTQPSSINPIITQPRPSSSPITHLPSDNDIDPFSNEMEKILDDPSLNLATSFTNLTTPTIVVNNNDQNQSSTTNDPNSVAVTDYYTLVTINTNDIASTDSTDTVDTQRINTTPITLIEAESDKNKHTICCCSNTNNNKISSLNNIKPNPNTDIIVVDDNESDKFINDSKEVEQKSCCCGILGCFSTLKNIFCPVANYVCTCTTKQEKLENTDTFEIIEDGKTKRQIKNNAYSTRTHSITANCNTCADACKVVGVLSPLCCGIV